MAYLWYDLHDLKGGQIVKIETSTAVNVKLMSYDSFTFYRSGLPYRYYGGFATKTPCYIKVPYDAPWVLVADLHYDGYFQIKNVSVGLESDMLNDSLSPRGNDEKAVMVNSSMAKTDNQENRTMNYKALIIGVNEYLDKSSYSDLDAVSNDVTAMSQILSNSPCQYQVANLSGRNATHAKITKELNHFFDSEDDDVLFLYWAGHGTGSYFIAHDTEPANQAGTAVDLSILADMIEQTRSRAVVIVLDCCYSGAIARGATNYGLQIKGDGKVIMASSDYFEQSFESPSLGHGHFTHCFIQGLVGAAASDSGLVTVTGLHDYICEQIDILSPNKQTPVLKLTMAGLFVLNRVEPAQHKQSTDNPGHVENTSNRDSVAQISHEEQIVVKALSLDDIASVHVNTTRTLSDSGLNIYIKGSIEKVRIDFNLSQTKREFTKWVEVVGGLVKKGLLEVKHYGSGKCYSLTHNGFTIADTVEESVLDNVPSMVDCDVDALSVNEKTMLKAVSVCKDGRIICSTDIISDSERIETIDGNMEFADGMDTKQTMLWDDVINCLVQGDMLVPLMGGKGKRYFRITNKGYAVASRINNDILDVFKKNS